MSKIKFAQGMVLDNQIFENFNKEDLSKVIMHLKNIYEDRWKEENQINTSIKLPLTIAINVTDDKKIKFFEETIEKFDLVSAFYVSRLDNEQIYYKVIFNGAPKLFISEMQKFGHKLDIKNKTWILK